MYKINDKVVITNSKDPYYRRRGEIILKNMASGWWIVKFIDGGRATYKESELKPYIKKISKPKEDPLTWDKPKCECGERIHLKLICTDFRFCNEDCYLKKQWRNDQRSTEPMWTPEQFTITVKLKITADTKELAKAKVRRYLDRQMLEGSVE